MSERSRGEQCLAARERMLRLVAPIPLALVVVACGGDETTSGGGGGTATTTGDTPSSSVTGGAGAGGTSVESGVLYAVTYDTLFAGDPSAAPFALSEVGRIECVPTWGKGFGTGVTDLAVNAAGDVWALMVTSGGHGYVFGASVVQVNAFSPSAVACAEPVQLEPPMDLVGLTFAPSGLLAPGEEVLVAASRSGQLWSIEASGALAPRGTLGVVPADDGHGHSYDPGSVWEASDLAFFDHGGIPMGFAIAQDCNPMKGCGPFASLLEIDVAALATASDQSVVKSIRGQIVRRAGCTDAGAGYGGIAGLGAWLGKLYGFAGQRALEIDPADGSACAIDLLAEPPEGSAWSGAGVTTSAPILSP